MLKTLPRKSKKAVADATANNVQNDVITDFEGLTSCYRPYPISSLNN